MQTVDRYCRTQLIQQPAASFRLKAQGSETTNNYKLPDTRHCGGEIGSVVSILLDWRTVVAAERISLWATSFSL